MNTDIITPVPFAETESPMLDPQPIAAALPAVARLVPQMLPPVIADYVFDVADRTQCPPDFVAVGALVACATLIGNRVRILPKQFDNWTVVPNLWGAVVGPPSAMKSPALKYALSPLNKIEREWRKQWEGESTQAEADAEVTKIVLEEARKEAKKKLKDNDRNAAREIIAEAQGAALVIPKRKRLTVNDATVEKLGELLNENPRGLLIVRDELPGLLAKLEDEAFQVDRAFYLEAFNGDASFKYDRIGRGTVEIEMATLSLVGGIQPARIAPIVRGAVSGSSADGLVQRLQLTVWPDLSKDWEWRDRRPDPDAEQDFEAAFLRLESLNLGTTETPALRRFTTEAQDHFIEWMTALQLEARSGAQSEALEAHLLKMPKTVASLALIFQLLSGDNEAIGDDALLHALAWADYLRTHAIRLYAAGTYAAEAGARLILNRREALPSPFRARDVHQKGWAGLSDRDAVEAALQILVATHNLAYREVSAGAGGGRPTSEYLWHPKITGGGQ
ncbi:YfjI family protein [Xanthobacter autotrophicus]|uniref:YfjI family protein n=1 Tax=Xanthobacter autotrophicus TaxID=280 RepID=UPI00372A5DCC